MESIVGYRLSPRQRHLWALLQDGAFRPREARALLRLRGELDEGALREALDRLVERHEVLRTSFERLPGMPEALQVIGEGAAAWDEAVDLAGVDAAERDARIEALWAGRGTEGAPLPAARLVRVADGEHLLLLRLHALMVDAASLEHLARELAALYAAAGDELDEPVPYLAVSEWLNEVAASEEAQAGRAYWIAGCEGEAALLPLEEEVPGPPAAARRALPAEVGAPLHALAERLGTDADTVLLAGWAALLHRLGRAERVRVGVAVDGRTDEELRHAVGPFTQHLPLTLAVDSALPFRELAQRARTAREDAAGWLECFDAESVHRFLAGDEAAEGTLEIRFGFSPAAAPLVHPAGPVEIALLRGEAAEDPFALHLRVERADGEAVLELRGDGSLSSGHVELMLERYAVLLADALARPEAPLGALRVAGPAELVRLLEEFNHTAARSEPGGRPVHELFAEQAARTPEAPALRSGAETVSYAELNARADRRARHLRALGVGPETRVGIMLPGSPERVETVLAVLKAGGAFLPLDPEYPQERLAFMIRDAGLPLVLTRSGLRGRVPALEGVRVIAWDEEEYAVADGGPLPPADPRSAAYVIYTSGSTGTPKGVVVEHGALAAHALSVREHYGLGADDRILLFASFNFDPSVEQLLPPLLSGACVVLREEGVMGMEALGRHVADAELTILNLPTAQWHLLAEEWAAGRSLPERCALRLVIAGGEAMLPHYVGRWQETPAAGARLLNAYGPTETVVTASTHDVPAGFCAAGTPRRVPIGRPFGNRSMYVLDARLEPVPLGIPGELCIGGEAVARGYLGRPDATAERFVPDPFGGEPGARLYRTGDRVRHGEDGTLVFLGRVDQQVKLRGFRIEPGEVEAALERHSEVREAAAVVREDAPGAAGRRLVAYVVPEAGARPDTAALREHLQGSLPEYMVPSALVVLERFPLNANGKVDRAALPAPVQGSEQAYAAPRNEVERVLAEIWREVLRLERVGIHDGFFEQGGDSILSIQVVSRARAAGLHLTPRQVFDHPTVAELAAVCGAAGDVVRAEQGAVVGAVETTPVQAWFFAREVPDPHHFNMSQLFEARGPLEGSALERAVARLLEHHDALRSRFRRRSGAWLQEVAPPEARPAVVRVDLSGLDEPRQRAELERASARMQRSLDLEHGPLVRVAWFDRGGERSARLLVAVHHLVTDGVSWRILLEDLQTAYAQALAGGVVQLPAKTTSFQRWAERLAAHARESGFAAELPYWTAEARRDVAPLPVDLPGGAETDTGATARSVSVALDEAETQALLQEVPRAYRTQVNDLLLTALARALAGWTGGDRVLVEMEGHGREEIFADVDLSRTVGWFTTLFPVLLDLSEARGEAGALKAVKEQLRGVPGRGIGYGALRYLGSPEARAALEALPEAEVRFEYLGQLDGAVAGDALFTLAAESAGPGASPRARRAHRLALTAAVLGGRLQARLGYGAALYRRETAERLAERFAAELRALVAHCTSAEAGGCTPSDFPLARLGQDELDRVLAGGRDVEDVYPLTSVQEGLLFHTLYSPGEGVYVGQFSYDLVGELDVEAFERAWQGALERHPALRTGFAWEGLESPVQVVRRRVALPLHREDWRALPAEEQEARRAAFLLEDQARGFDPAQAPLLRLALFRTAEDRHHLVCTQHHLVLDGWSLPLVFRDVAELYGAHAAGRAPVLPPARPYRDYVAWLATRDPGAAERFWREEMAGVTAHTTVHLLPARAAARGSAAATLRLPAETAARIDAAARRHGLTANTLLQGAWTLVLARYSGEEDVVFGATLSGRPGELEGVEGIVGLFINTLPVRTRVSPGERALPWLAALQERNVRRREHEHTPLVRVQQWSGVPGGQPLFESILVFENYPVGESMGRGEQALRVATRGAAVQTSYPLTLSAALGRDLFIRAEYQADRFDADAVARMLGHLARALESLVDDPARPLGSVSLLDAAERERLLAEAAVPAAAPPRIVVPRLFAEQAARTPHAAAVRAGGEELGYAELERRARRLAHHLRGRGVGPETAVGVCLERSADLVVALLAVLEAGGVFVPLDPAYPGERLDFMLGDSGARVLVTRSGLAGGLGADGDRTVLLDRDADRIAREPETPVEDGPEPEHLAYVIYTSGSTGRPKGVRVEHRSLAATLLAARERFGWGPGDEMPGLASHSFDIWLFETLLPLLCGATVRPVPSERVLDVPALLREVRGATLLHAVPALMGQVLEQASAAGLELPRLRQAFVGGDAVAPELLARMRAAWPDAEVRVLYGPTEGAVICAAHPVPADGGVPGRMLGSPLGNAALHVCDAAGELVPSGVPGELCLGGASVARDYLGLPGLTAEKFVPDPFSGRPGARLYRTGDRVRRLPDGALEFLGRTDHQVKIRGFRIEPGEVAGAILRDGAVREAVVVPRQNGAGPRLVAYVVGAGAGLDTDALRGRLRDVLPEYMVPSAVVRLDSLPLGPNGKVDRSRLPAPEHLAGERDTTAPRDATEALVARIWGEVLDAPRVGVHDDLFDLGGNSLLVMRIAARVRAALGMEVPLAVFFTHTTVAGLAEWIRTVERGSAPEHHPIPRAGRAGPLPLSFAQERLWFIERAEDTGSGYALRFGLRLGGEVLDVPALEQSFSLLLERHEVLRTVFPAVDGEARQVILPPEPFRLPVMDLEGEPAEAREARVAEVAASEGRRPFDLERGPLFRALLLRLDPAEHVLLVNIHHIVFDGWSTGILVRELTACYRAFRAGARPELPELPVQYADYAAWQRDWLRSAAVEEQVAFWKRRLAGLPALDLSGGRPRPERPGPRGANLSLRLSPDTSARLAELARERQATLFMLLLAVFKVVLAHHGRTRDVVVGTDAAGRSRVEVEPLVGFFINELVLRTDLSGDPAFASLLERVRGVTLDAFRHQDLPFGVLVRELGARRSAGTHPLFQVMFGMDNTPSETVQADDLRVAPVNTASDDSPWELSLYVRETPGGIAGSFTYRTDLFDASAIEAMKRDFVAVAERVAARPGLGVEALLEELAAGERARRAERARAAEEASRSLLKTVRRKAISITPSTE